MFFQMLKKKRNRMRQHNKIKGKNNINRKPHRKVTKLKSKFLIAFASRPHFPFSRLIAVGALAERGLGIEPSAYTVSSQCLVDYS